LSKNEKGTATVTVTVNPGLDLIVCRVWVDFSFRPTLGRK